MSKYVISTLAKLDLYEIIDFIDNKNAVTKFHKKLIDALNLIAENPNIGHYREDLFGHKQLRVWSVYHYMIIYKSDTNPIQIVRVVSSYRNTKELTIE